MTVKLNSSVNQLLAHWRGAPGIAHRQAKSPPMTSIMSANMRLKATKQFSTRIMTAKMKAAIKAVIAVASLMGALWPVIVAYASESSPTALLNVELSR